LAPAVWLKFFIISPTLSLIAVNEKFIFYNGLVYTITGLFRQHKLRCGRPC
jgi:hypothetical protein